MQQLEWRDDSSYSRDEASGINPTVISVTVGGLKLIVHRHMDYPGEWLVTCRALGFEKRSLGALTLEHAKTKGLLYVASVARSRARDADTMLAMAGLK